jgi:hypothetical protein
MFSVSLVPVDENGTSFLSFMISSTICSVSKRKTVHPSKESDHIEALKVPFFVSNTEFIFAAI